MKTSHPVGRSNVQGLADVLSLVVENPVKALKEIFLTQNPLKRKMVSHQKKLLSLTKRKPMKNSTDQFSLDPGGFVTFTSVAKNSQTKDSVINLNDATKEILV